MFVIAGAQRFQITMIEENTMKEVMIKAADFSEMAITEGPQTVRVVATKEIIDRDGDLIKVDGIDFAEYMQNPVFIWGHDQGEMPIGKVTELIKTKGADGVAQLEAVIEFAETDDGQEAAYLYANGFLNAVSICFRPVNMQEVFINSVLRGYDVTACKLYEISAVNIPANQAALVIKGLVKTARKTDELEKALTASEAIATANTKIGRAHV